MFTNFSPDLFIPLVMDREACGKHAVPQGVPCFHVRTQRGVLPAICNGRAKKTGFNAKISESSLRLASQRRKK